jgi:hypothetical protein
MTRADLLAAKRKGHTHVVSRDRITKGKPVEYHPISTHRTYADAAKALQSSKGNAIYPLDELLAP